MLQFLKVYLTLCQLWVKKNSIYFNYTELPYAHYLLFKMSNGR